MTKLGITEDICSTGRKSFLVSEFGKAALTSKTGKNWFFSDPHAVLKMLTGLNRHIDIPPKFLRSGFGHLLERKTIGIMGVWTFFEKCLAVSRPAPLE
jgi:hypothetical protein